MVFDVPGLTALRTAACRQSGLVHLVPVMDRIPAQASLCGSPVTRRPPDSLFHLRGCPACSDRAIALGTAFAEDRHGAMVNLQRLRPAGS